MLAGLVALCAMPPATKDACDTADMPDAMACDDGNGGGCIPCALADYCQPALSKCQQSTDCQDFATAIQDCPN